MTSMKGNGDRVGSRQRSALCAVATAIVWPAEEHATSIHSRSVRDCSSDQDVVAKDLSQYGQVNSDDQDQHYIESRVSSVARSSAGRLSTGRSSPAVFAAPLPSGPDAHTIDYPPPSFSRLISMNSLEWKQGLIGSLSAIAFGAIQPVYALTIGGMISAFFSPSHEEMRARIQTYALIFSTLSIISIVVNLLQHYNFSYMGEQLTKRIRLKMLEKVLTFEAA
ncbi:hypothetical protein RHMOL_Rhmol03G0261500 [Rhododendron molle]|uniref:Uncharacterized protein n=1 Tax=Rhododendron molle TaxID=49168 RepID=A0ACC0PIX4_RHOML|nr:hypothetical protein RHMOL_Rhmol03G0261500 [Rhododendron molle]